MSEKSRQSNMFQALFLVEGWMSSINIERRFWLQH